MSYQCSKWGAPRSLFSLRLQSHTIKSNLSMRVLGSAASAGGLRSVTAGLLRSSHGLAPRHFYHRTFPCMLWQTCLPMRQRMDFGCFPGLTVANDGVTDVCALAFLGTLSQYTRLSGIFRGVDLLVQTTPASTLHGNSRL